MPNSDPLSRASLPTPDYKQLVQFLLEPLLDAPESLRVDCEYVNSSTKIWIRVAFEQEDKGKVFGRGGRNIKAIELVLNTSTESDNQQIYLDVYGNMDTTSSAPRDRERSSFSRGKGESVRRTRTSSSRRPRTPKPAPQLRSFDEN